MTVTTTEAPLVEMRDVSKYYGNVIALTGISTTVNAGEVTCVLGDNGAGKSTLIKILAGVHHQSEGELAVEGEVVSFDSPRDALAHGIATVYQDLALVPLMSVWRNFFLGAEPTKGFGPFRRIDRTAASEIAKAELAKMGIDIRDTEQFVGTMSGGERQSVAIARAAYFGAKVLILDEPTSALGVKQSGVVLKYIVAARERGLGVIFITHNPHHAYPVGDRFLILNRGRSMGDYPKAGLSKDELVRLMAGGSELEELTHELEQAAEGVEALRSVAEEFEEEIEELEDAPALMAEPGLEVLTAGRVSVDLYPEQANVPLADVATFAKSLGGTATNVAVAAARLGHRAAVVTKVGDDPFGPYVRQALRGFGVDASLVGTDPDLQTPVVFAELDPPEDPGLLFYRKPKAPDMNLFPDDVDRALVESVPIFWIPGSRFSEEPSRSTVRTWLGWRARRTHTVLDLDYRPMFWSSEDEAHRHVSPVLAEVTVALGNRTECAVAVGTSDPDEAADRLLAEGVQLAIVKMGGDGVLVATAKVRERVAPQPVEVVCGLGAGDAFGGAVCHGLLAGWGPVDIVRFANAAGAIVAGRLACADAMPSVGEVEAVLGAAP